MSNYQFIEEYEEAGDISVHYIEEKEAVIYDLAEEIKKQIEGREKVQYEKEELQRKIEQERKRFQQELKSSREIKAKYKETKENLERIVKENEERKSLIEGFLVSPPPNLLSPTGKQSGRFCAEPFRMFSTKVKIEESSQNDSARIEKNE